MADGSRPESGAGEAEAPKIKAEDNPWYLLATLYGSGQQEKNRIAWNRYFAARLDPQLKADLIANGRYEEEELTPFLPEQLAEIKRAFAEQSAASISNLPCPKHDWSIHFKNVRFDGSANFEGFIFLARSSSMRLISIMLPLPVWFISTKPCSRMRPSSGQQLSIELISRTRLSWERPISTARRFTALNFLAEQNSRRMCPSMTLLSKERRTSLMRYLPGRAPL